MTSWQKDALLDFKVGGFSLARVAEKYRYHMERGNLIVDDGTDPGDQGVEIMENLVRGCMEIKE